MLALLAGTATAGPWIRDPGDWYVKGSLSEFRTAEYIDPGAAAALGDGAGQTARFVGHTASFYGEVGLLDGLQLVADLPYTWSFNRFPGSELRYTIDGPGSARLGLGLTHPDLTVPASLTVLARVPLFGGVERLPLDPALGENQVDLDAVVGLGGAGAFGPAPLWAVAELGVRVRTGWILAESDPVRGRGAAALYHAQLGWRPGWGWVQVEGTGTVGLGASRTMHQLGLGTALRLLDGLHLEAGPTWTWRARAEATGWGWSVGLSHQRTRTDENG